MSVLSRDPVQLRTRLSLWAARVRTMISKTNLRRTPAPPDVGAYDLSAIRCFREAYIERLTDRDCAEFYAPDGRLIWESRANEDA